ncbi:MAG: amidohydrolase family protein [Deltaproteobacteria bacterium]|nr:amidohydrolase family protein [Deltaproteobacteria bacterium]
MGPVEVLFNNGKIVTQGKVIDGFVAVDRGKIVGVGEGEIYPEAEKTIDLKGRTLIPGVVDPEVHFGSHRWVGDEFDSETRGAAAYGITTWGFMQPSPNMGQPYKAEKSEEEVLPYSEVFGLFKELGESRSMVDFFLTPKILRDEHALEIPRLAKEFGMTSFKYQLHLMSPERTATFWPNRKSQGYFGYDDGTIYLGLEAVAKLGPPAIVCMHCENWEIARIFEERLIKAGRKEYRVWNERSPHFCEAGHVHTYTYYARITKCPLYIQHTTTAETIEEITRARADGATVYAQTGPHYLGLTEDAWRINVPLRSAETIEVLWQALADGRIDSVGSDHTNANKSRKEMEVPGDIWATKTGFPSRGEAHLPVMLNDGVNRGRITLLRMAQVCCENPARIFGLYPKKGVIAPGSDADLVVVDLERKVTVTNDMVHSSAGWTLWEGKEMKGWPVMTMLRGKVIAEWKDGGRRPEIVSTPFGRYLPRSLG